MLPDNIDCTPALDLYWQLAAKRQSILSKRLRGEPRPWTDDPILRKHKFTCTFRASDRTSQYCIKEVIYEGGSMEPEEVVFRILLFKLFNLIETWKLLTATVGPLTWKTFNLKSYGAVLDKAQADKVKIFTSAYMQRPQTGFDVDEQRNEVKGKHNRYLRLLEAMMRSGIAAGLQTALSYEHAYRMLRNFPSPAIGPFAAMQWLTDINYSPVLNFDEDDFIVPGRGAIDGINKCFSGLSLKENNDGDLRLGAQVIQDCVAKQEDYFKEYGLKPVTLFGRKLHLIDCQNLFCEVDKYCRVALPKLNQGRTEIKHMFTPTGPLPKPFFPPKWNIN
jgi:hypothetical protein